MLANLETASSASLKRIFQIILVTGNMINAVSYTLVLIVLACEQLNLKWRSHVVIFLFKMCGNHVHVISLVFVVQELSVYCMFVLMWITLSDIGRSFWEGIWLHHHLIG